MASLSERTRPIISQWLFQVRTSVEIRYIGPWDPNSIPLFSVHSTFCPPLFPFTYLRQSLNHQSSNFSFVPRLQFFLPRSPVCIPTPSSIPPSFLPSVCYALRGASFFRSSDFDSIPKHLTISLVSAESTTGRRRKAENDMETASKTFSNRLY